MVVGLAADDVDGKVWCKKKRKCVDSAAPLHDLIVSAVGGNECLRCHRGTRRHHLLGQRRP